MLLIISQRSFKAVFNTAAATVVRPMTLFACWCVCVCVCVCVCSQLS